MASHDKLDNLIATVDVNRLGQSRPTMLEHDMDALQARWEAFGWRALVVDGHSIEALLDAYATALTAAGAPTVVLAKTYKAAAFRSRKTKTVGTENLSPARRSGKR